MKWEQCQNILSSDDRLVIHIKQKKKCLLDITPSKESAKKKGFSMITFK